MKRTVPARGKRERELLFGIFFVKSLRKWNCFSLVKSIWEIFGH